ncbi:MAG: alkaline phosphatase family protein [Actinomycetota bacterium]|nr:alkaline phosphatase family protein [Actinomycetota bacterium]
MRVLLIILDGLGDRPAPELGGKTPLEAACTPNLDSLAARGITGLMDPISPGIAPGSDVAHFLLFGYSLDEFPGRGVFEAVGEGLDLGSADVVCRASFASVEEKGGCLKIVDRSIGAAEEDCRELSRGVSEKEFGRVKFSFVYNGGRQGILFLRGEASSNITDSDPFDDTLPVIKIQPLQNADDKEKAKRTAGALNSYLCWVYGHLKDHPVNQRRMKGGKPPLNFLLTKWAARRRKLVPFAEKFGFGATMVASGVLYRGLAAEMGMDFIESPNLKETGEDLKSRLRLAKQAFEGGCDFVHLHTKAPDEAAHTKKPFFKRDTIEKLDGAFEGLSSFFSGDVLIVVTSDHSTPSSGSLIHSGEPVPIAIVGKNVRKDEVKEFGERACSRGGLGRIRGSDLMNVILNLTDRVKYFGTRSTPEDIPHRPRKVIPFKI